MFSKSSAAFIPLNGMDSTIGSEYRVEGEGEARLVLEGLSSGQIKAPWEEKKYVGRRHLVSGIEVILSSQYCKSCKYE